MRLYEYVLAARDSFSDTFDKLQRAAGGVESKVEGVSKQMKNAESSTSSWGSMLGSLKNTLVAVFAIGSIVTFGNAVVETTAKFQKYDAVLTNTLGTHEQAVGTMKMLKDFAATTPFGIDELTGSFVKLANQGFQPTKNQMRQLGDLASSQGKSFDQLTEAALDATTFQFERLKEFGIKAQQSGDKVSFTFKGVTQTVGKNADEIRAYMLSLGDMKGVKGGMEAISQTLGGQISNLGDNFDMLKLKIGTLFSGSASQGIGLLNAGLAKTNEFLDFIGENTEALGQVFAPLMGYIDPIIGAFEGISTKIKSAVGEGNLMEKFFNKIGAIMEFLSPLFSALGELIGTVISKLFDIGVVIYEIFDSDIFKGFYGYFVSIFTSIATVAKDILGGVADLVVGIFTMDMTKIKAGVSSLGDAVSTGFTAGYKAVGAGVDAYNDADKPSKNFFDKKTKVASAAGASADEALGATSTTGASATSAVASSGIDKVAGGGKQSVNVNINVGKMIETITLTPANLQEGLNDIEEMVLKLIARILNGANYAAGQ